MRRIVAPPATIVSDQHWPIDPGKPGIEPAPFPERAQEGRVKCGASTAPTAMARAHDSPRAAASQYIEYGAWASSQELQEAKWLRGRAWAALGPLNATAQHRFAVASQAYRTGRALRRTYRWRSCFMGVPDLVRANKYILNQFACLHWFRSQHPRFCTGDICPRSLSTRSR